jgi:hypothetical protein
MKQNYKPKPKVPFKIKEPKQHCSKHTRLLHLKQNDFGVGSTRAVQTLNQQGKKTSGLKLHVSSAHPCSARQFCQVYS